MDELQLFLLEVSPIYAYSLLFITTALENLFPPFPGDTVTVIAAYLVGRDSLGIWWTYIITTAGSLVGFLVLYGVGLRFGRGYFYRKDFKYFGKSTIQEVEQLFDRWGILIIAVNRFLSGLRAVISLVAGIAEYDWRVVTGLGFISCVLWNGALIYAGSRVGENWETVLFYIRQYNVAVFIIVGAAVLFWGYFHLYLPVKAANRGEEKKR
ncbi:MAG: DedA family protein [Candidatus Marinimicrobia bacterium]|nr:DedA family protein [Candidatus Neomarinimicrobiota bacterium]MCF7829055.1 DedA family protein [Candidatus Neomarinimicrobiota bacterium]MCF7881808.1 DedA family protein [Candidatus Neomarinimicrobiota bacterium]